MGEILRPDSNQDGETVIWMSVYKCQTTVAIVFFENTSLTIHSKPQSIGDGMEMESLMKHNVWDLANLPPGKKVLAANGSMLIDLSRGIRQD